MLRGNPDEECLGCKRDPSKLRTLTLDAGAAAMVYTLAKRDRLMYEADPSRGLERLELERLQRIEDEAHLDYVRAGKAQVAAYDAKGKMAARAAAKGRKPEPRPIERTPNQQLAHDLIDQSCERARLGLDPPPEFVERTGKPRMLPLSTLRMIARGEAARIEAEKQRRRDHPTPHPETCAP
jgi:hypothetical protein